MRNILPENEAIKAAHPMNTGRHDLYAEALRLVGERHGKGELTELVNWLLWRLETESGHKLLEEKNT